MTKFILSLFVLAALTVSCGSQRDEPDTNRGETYESLEYNFGTAMPGKFDALSDAQLKELGLTEKDFFFFTPENYTYTLDPRVAVGNRSKSKFYRQDLRNNMTTATYYNLAVLSRTESVIRQKYEFVSKITGLPTTYKVTGVDDLTLKDISSWEIEYNSVEYKYDGATESDVKRLKQKIVKCSVKSDYKTSTESLGFYTLPSGQKVKAVYVEFERQGNAECADGTVHTGGIQKVTYVETIHLSDLDEPASNLSATLFYYTEVSSKGKLLYRSKTERWE